MGLRYKVLGTDDRPLKDAKGDEIVFETEEEAAAVRDEVVGRRVMFCDEEGRILGR